MVSYSVHTDICQFKVGLWYTTVPLLAQQSYYVSVMFHWYTVNCLEHTYVGCHLYRQYIERYVPQKA